MKNNGSFNSLVLKITGIIISGILWYLSTGLNGDFFYLTWLAPIPILMISLEASGKQTFFVSVLAYLIGRLSWFSYLTLVATLIPAIIITLVLSLSFALIVVLSRFVVLRIKSWIAVFVFPVFFTTFEFFLMKFSADGSAGSIAYSQSDFLPVIQVASVTGILGITFLLTLFPSAVALSWFYRKQKSKIRKIFILTSLLLVSSLLFGVIRINTNNRDTIKAGLIVLEEKYHNISKEPDFKEELITGNNYVKEISSLVAKGVKFIVLPERAINISKENEDTILALFTNIALQDKVCIIIGYTNFRNENPFNSALVINEEGKIMADYNKVHLVTGFENWFFPGNETGLFISNGINCGTAICKDLDFSYHFKKYANNNTGILFVPAWDFKVDDWLHSRMAVLRGVEYGFSEVRAARSGKLLISDCYGKVTSESVCTDNMKASLTGDVSYKSRNTLYSRFGDWFGFANVLTALSFIIVIIFKKNI